MYARVLRNAFTEEYRAAGAPVLPAFLQFLATADVRAAAAERGDRDHYPLYAGQGLGLIHDVPGAGDVVRAVVREARAVLDRLGARAPSS
jgi:NAD(P)H-dependent flavin oxidoreductase YrpB (nitropropane dioxygenase family)